ncbi:MAG: tRNA (adenosine(37)-N6)-dimethylallyltransferase MiaA [Clostridiales bacterium]|nr:tRNA (adenosine(37)-N6)-dimethylallyltransferase MiaA [Clostridiales bacterium]
MKPQVIAIVGATASGKSSLSMRLAETLNAEIVCMDSMQIYRGMDIGTAKPTAEEQQRIRHHMLDIVSPDEPFAVADYADMAQNVITDIIGRGKLPMLVGGTGLYLKALMHGLSLGVAKSDPAIRARYEAIANEPNGKNRLHDMLAQVDCPSAQRLHPNDLRRVIRALEIYELTGKPMSEAQTEAYAGAFDVLPLAIRMEREQLYARIEKRIDQMFAMGLLEEVRRLLAGGLPGDAQSMQGIGYKELVPVALGQMPVSEARKQLILHTKHYAKRQETWFRGEEKVVWLDTELAYLQALEAVRRFLRNE